MSTNPKGSHDFILFSKVVHRKAKLIFSTLLLIVVAILLLDWSFVRYRLLDEAIAPEFWGGQKVVTCRWSYLFTQPRRQDLIIYSPIKDIYLPGKVIAVAGDNVTTFNGAIYVNGNPVPNSEDQSLKKNKPLNLRVAPGYVGVLGAPTTDTGRFKLVPLTDIEGKILGPWQVLII